MYSNSISLKPVIHLIKEVNKTATDSITVIGIEILLNTASITL